MKSQISNFRWAAILAAALCCQTLHAFPPAPHHTFTGTVRDEQGNPITAENARVILEASSGVTVETPVIFGLAPGLNYRLEVPMDAGITADAYKPTALRPQVPFTIRVRIGNRTYLPIELVLNSGSLGEAGGVTVLDLTLGEDTDGDGLPDAWERALIQALAGLNSLADVNPNDDSDGDGLTNLQEYISGTFAFDKSDEFTLEVAGFNEGAPRLRFLSIRGRTYTVLGSPDLKSWGRVAFTVPAVSSGVVQVSHRAEDVRELEIEVPLTGEQAACRFFKLTVQ